VEILSRTLAAVVGFRMMLQLLLRAR